MSRKIDFSKPLDPSDYDYLAARPWLYRGQSIEDLEFADGEHDDADTDDNDENDENDDPIDDSDDNTEAEDDESDEDEELDDEDGEEEDLDEDDEEEDDEEDLESLSVPALKDLARERGISVPKGSKKEDLVDLLS